ncbi:hypothetical protein ABB37_03792 [Leptomonas pyrrhocoris]|uniref:Uncharacterized protein n=1 Tax=Leptomonas pyrrhocoris TaxID=157538 RepID=A0A0N0DW75_LEPPY|nr:hypothetical protein ABB37_03792 [Leptomonas pyrrhocoris]KPA81422.1 hypothetical protein ABB37_03792 [Leptomonas pyrrhocoris]|eukprot:XP_015659861.1 hypothetical protein ABB37_03792 [Leptomonas pyrrhocoris]
MSFLSFLLLRTLPTLLRTRISCVRARSQTAMHPRCTPLLFSSSCRSSVKSVVD